VSSGTIFTLSEIGLCNRLLKNVGPPLGTGLSVTQKLPDNHCALPELESQLCLHTPWREIVIPNGQPDFDLLDKTVPVFRKTRTKYQIRLRPGAVTQLIERTHAAILLQ